MFEFVRTHTRLLQFILVILIFPSFVFFGVQGYSSFNEGGKVDVAKVDGRGITQAEWDAAHQRNIDRYRAQMPNIDAKLLDSPEARRETLDGLIRERVLLNAAQTQHLLPGDERLKRLFATDPQFQGLRNADGSVNRDILAAQGMTSEMLAQNLRLEFGMRQVLAGVGGTTIAPKASATTALDALLQRREIQVQRFEAKDYAAKVAPTDAELEAYFKANEARFKLPEQADIEYVVLDVEALKKDVTAPEDELRRYYAENASRYSVAEERRASHILIKADKDMPAGERQKAKARAEALLADARKAPATFGDLARKNSDDTGSAAQGRRPRLLRPRRDGQAVRGRRLRDEARRDRQRRRDPISAITSSSSRPCAAATRSRSRRCAARSRPRSSGRWRSASSPRPPSSSRTSSTNSPTACSR